MHTILNCITGMSFVGIEPGKLYYLAPVTRGAETTLSGTGTVVLEDAVGDWVELSIHGRSEQQTTTGAQLVNVETSDINEHIEIIDETITLKSGATGRFNYFEIPEMTLEPGTYTMSLDNIDGMQNDGTLQIGFRLKTTNINTDNKVATTNWFVGGSASETNGIGTVTIEESTLIKYLVVDIIKGNFEGQRFRVMLNAGSKPLTWESYTGGQPSPNPDYPQEIKSCGEKTAQLFKIPEGSATIAGINYSKGANGGIFVSGTATRGGMKTSPYFTENKVTLQAGTYTLCGYCENGDSLEFGLETPSAEAIGDFVKANTPTKYTLQEDTEVVAFVQVKKDQTANEEVFIMLGAGDAALPWEPHGYKIETTLDNAGYLERGSTFDNVKKIALKKGCKYKLHSENAGNNKNAFIFTDGDLNFSGGNSLYGYGYVTIGLTEINKSGVASGPCRLNGVWNPSVEFEVVEDGLYLYYAVNTPSEDTDDVWVWTGEGCLTDTSYRSQTITSYLSDGLPGIPVPSGGNYTDEDGQQWITDEIDFRRGKYVQRVWKGTLDGSEQWFLYGAYGSVFCGFISGNVLPEIMSKREGFCNQFKVSSVDHIYTEEMWLGLNSYSVACVSNPFRDSTAEDSGLSNWKAHLAQNPMEVMTYLETPIETDLSAEEIEAYKALHAYKPTTIITADGGEVEPGITAKYQKGE